MKKSSYLPALILLAGIILLGVTDSVDNHVLQIKLGITGKIALIVGVFGLWLFTILPIFKEKENPKE